LSSDVAVSRPELDRLMRDMRKQRFAAVLVARFDRFAWSTTHLLRALEEFRKHGVAFISLNESVDTSTAIGKIVVTTLRAVAEMERVLIQERVNAGLDLARRQGKRLGRPPVDLNIETVRRLHADGFGVRQIAKELGCSASTIHRTLRERARIDNCLNSSKAG
jgi:DNA invertase Pin-like site-specific DNA recombinase